MYKLLKMIPKIVWPKPWLFIVNVWKVSPKCESIFKNPLSSAWHDPMSLHVAMQLDKVPLGRGWSTALVRPGMSEMANGCIVGISYVSDECDGESRIIKTINLPKPSLYIHKNSVNFVIVAPLNVENDWIHHNLEQRPQVLQGSLRTFGRQFQVAIAGKAVVSRYTQILYKEIRK